MCQFAHLRQKGPLHLPQDLLRIAHQIVRHQYGVEIRNRRRVQDQRPAEGKARRRRQSAKQIWPTIVEMAAGEAVYVQESPVDLDRAALGAKFLDLALCFAGGSDSQTQPPTKIKKVMIAENQIL
jgi:hypothetical protein